MTTDSPPESLFAGEGTFPVPGVCNLQLLCPKLERDDPARDDEVDNRPIGWAAKVGIYPVTRSNDSTSNPGVPRELPNGHHAFEHGRGTKIRFGPGGRLSPVNAPTTDPQARLRRAIAHHSRSGWATRTEMRAR